MQQLKILGTILSFISLPVTLSMLVPRWSFVLMVRVENVTVTGIVRPATTPVAMSPMFSKKQWHPGLAVQYEFNGERVDEFPLDLIAANVSGDVLTALLTASTLAVTFEYALPKRARND